MAASPDREPTSTARETGVARSTMAAPRPRRTASHDANHQPERHAIRRRAAVRSHVRTTSRSTDDAWIRLWRHVPLCSVEDAEAPRGAGANVEEPASCVDARRCCLDQRLDLRHCTSHLSISRRRRRRPDRLVAQPTHRHRSIASERASVHERCTASGTVASSRLIDARISLIGIFSRSLYCDEASVIELANAVRSGVAIVCGCRCGHEAIGWLVQEPEAPEVRARCGSDATRSTVTSTSSTIDLTHIAAASPSLTPRPSHPTHRNNNNNRTMRLVARIAVIVVASAAVYLPYELRRTTATGTSLWQYTARALDRRDRQPAQPLQ